MKFLKCPQNSFSRNTRPKEITCSRWALRKKIIETGNAPIIEMGLVEKTGQHRGIGAGIYHPPMELFHDA